MINTEKNFKKIFIENFGWESELDEILNMRNEFHDDVDNILKKFNKLIGGYGVESCRSEDWVSHYYQDIRILYVSKGDTYEMTVCYDTEKDKFYCCSVGDYIEYLEGEGVEIL